jgi:UDP-sugar diphosphatase
MKNIIEDFKLEKLKDTKFVHPVKITYKQNGINKVWEAVKSFDSVSVLLYHEKKNAFLLVKQFRPAVFLNDKKTFTYELCAGIIDKDKSLEEIVKEEISEECGFEVKTTSIEKITSFYTNVGVSGSKQYLYYASIDDSMKVGLGGGINDEEIELYYLPLEEIESFIFDESKAKTPGLMFSFYWFMKSKNEIFINN